MDSDSGQIRKRLTFAIISHPDAGKTTITEKLLLFGGAIHVAGAVKGGKAGRQTTSDFMKMEQERGISISTSVMGFEYGGRSVNLLDTPGHADFSEDTFRGLSAVDSALIVIDAVKGVEERTRRLCEVSRMRDTPIATFINKMDREGKEPIELLDEIERELDIGVRPLTWPIGQGRSFKGVFDLRGNRLHLFAPKGEERPDEVAAFTGPDDPGIDAIVGESAARRLREELALVSAVYPPFSEEEYRRGAATPVFFGSALNNFGIRELLDNLVEFAPPPLSKTALERVVDPEEEALTGFIFKIHANLNPRHRDRIAFLRVCSGRFERNKTYLHVRTGKPFRSANPTAFMAQNREIIDEAWAGDIIGIHDTGTFAIGDTITEGEALHYRGIPAFAPQIFRTIRNADPLREKQFRNGLDHLAEEGVAQILSKRKSPGARVVGVVGQLQLEVLQARLVHEYGASCVYGVMDYSIARWVDSDDRKALDAFLDEHERRILVDAKGGNILMCESEWELGYIVKKNAKIRFHTTNEALHGT
ncbi:MAG: peptide chain release factor 3 [Spirochaetales bacterium]|nr:peptide chain release factor 3 [Spirochaetales bacterium]